MDSSRYYIQSQLVLLDFELKKKLRFSANYLKKIFFCVFLIPKALLF